MSKIRQNRHPGSFCEDYWWNLIKKFFFDVFILGQNSTKKHRPTVFWKFCILQSSFPPSSLFCILQPTSLVAVISTFLTKSMSSSSCWFLFLSSTESSLFFNAGRCWLDKLLNFLKTTFLVFVGVWWGMWWVGFQILFWPHFVWLQQKYY